MCLEPSFDHAVRNCLEPVKFKFLNRDSPGSKSEDNNLEFLVLGLKPKSVKLTPIKVLLFGRKRSASYQGKLYVDHLEKDGCDPC